MTTDNNLQVQMDIIELNLLAVGGNIILSRVLGTSIDKERVEKFLGESIDALLNAKRLLGLSTNLKKVE